MKNMKWLIAIIAVMAMVIGILSTLLFVKMTSDSDIADLDSAGGSATASRETGINQPETIETLLGLTEGENGDAGAGETEPEYPQVIDESRIGTYATQEEIKAYIDSHEYGYIQAIKKGDDFLITCMYDNSIGNWKVITEGEGITYTNPYDFDISAGDKLVCFCSGGGTDYTALKAYTYGNYALPVTFQKRDNGTKMVFNYNSYDNLRHCCIDADLPANIDDATVLTINGVDLTNEWIDSNMYEYDKDAIDGSKYAYLASTNREVVTIGVYLDSEYKEYSFVTNSYFMSAERGEMYDFKGYYSKEGYVVQLDSETNMDWGYPGEKYMVMNATLIQIVSGQTESD